MNFSRGSFIDAVNTLNNRDAFTKFSDSIVLNSYDPKFIASNMERYLESTFSPCIEQAIAMLQGSECSGTVVLNGVVYDAAVLSQRISQALDDGDENPIITLKEGVSMSLTDIANSVKDQISATAATIAAYGSIAAGSSIEYLNTKARSLSLVDDGAINDYLNAYSSILSSKSSDLTKIASIGQMLQATEAYTNGDDSLIIVTDTKFGCGSPLSLSSFAQVFTTAVDVVAGVLLMVGNIYAKIVGLVILVVKVIIEACKSYTEDVDDWYLMNDNAAYSNFCYYPIIQHRCTISDLRSKTGVALPSITTDDSIANYVNFVAAVRSEKRSYCELHNDYHLFMWVDDDNYFNLQVFGNTKCSTSGLIGWIEGNSSSSSYYLLASDTDNVNCLRQYGIIGTGTNLPTNNSDYVRSYGIACALSQFATDNCFYGFGFDNPVPKINKICDIIEQWHAADRTGALNDWITGTVDSSDFAWLTNSLLFTGYNEYGATLMMNPDSLGMSINQCQARSTLIFNCSPSRYTIFDYPIIDASNISSMFHLSPVEGRGMLMNTILEKWFMLSNIDSMKFLPYSSDNIDRSYGYGLRDQEYYNKVGSIAAAAIITVAATITAVAAVTYTKIRLSRRATLENAQVSAAANQVYYAKTQFGTNSQEYTDAVKSYNSQIAKAKWYNLLTGKGYSYSGSPTASLISGSNIDLSEVISLIK